MTKNNTTNLSYRELKDYEIKALFALYDKHNGNIKAISEDEDSQFRTRNQVAYYRDLYDFSSKFQQIVAQRATEYKEQILSKLGEKKLKALEKAFELLETRTRRLVNFKTGIEFDVEVYPNYKEIEAAWKMIRIELGQSVNNLDLTSGGKQLQGNQITFVKFTNENEPKS